MSKINKSNACVRLASASLIAIAAVGFAGGAYANDSSVSAEVIENYLANPGALAASNIAPPTLDPGPI